MNDKKTEVVLILDKSGSMAGKENDTIGGYNSFIENQKKKKENVLFQHIYFLINQKQFLCIKEFVMLVR